MRARRTLAACALALAGAAALPGCALLDAQGDIESVGQTTTIVGTVATPQAAHFPVIVGLIRDDGGPKSFTSYYLRRGEGPFRFQQGAGRYHVFAFEDRNENLHYDEGELAYYAGGRGTPVAVAAGKTIDVGRLDLRAAVPEGLAEVRAIVKRDLAGSPELSRVHRGSLAAWNDPRFTPAAGTEGMWTPYEALKKYGAGMFFFEPYDPARVPVVFVHGINGTALDFKPIIDGLDRQRFQAWVFQYPSGFRLELLSAWLASILEELQIRYRVSQYAIVAHSMGGLVSRGAVNRIVAQGGAQPIALYVTISTPWEGHEAAEMGTRFSPVVLPVWLDMSPGSPYLKELFRSPLPDTQPYYLFFGYRGGSGTDGTVSLRSMLDLAAQDRALRVAGLPEDHDSILKSPLMIERLNALLDRYAAPRAASANRR